MKNILKIYYILPILLITCLIQILFPYKNNKLKKIEEKKFKMQSEKIKNCIDINNKNKRTFNENIKLSEYCIDNFGSI